MGCVLRSDLGRGAEATADMKARIAHLRANDVDWLPALWERYVDAITGDGFSYEYANAGAAAAAE